MDGSRDSTMTAEMPAGDGEGYSPLFPDFPARLRVLLVDDDPVSLRLVGQKLRLCLYEVTFCSGAEIALSTLRKRKGEYDLVISDVHMPNIDGLQLLKHIELEMDLPVIMMSADEGNGVIMKGVTHGACDYIIKPVKMDYIKIIWQHVLRKKMNELKKPGSIEESNKQNRPLDEVENALSANQGNSTNSTRERDGKEEEYEIVERDDSSALKKPRVVWTPELHRKFNAAMKQLGIDKAVPKKILELMNVPGLTRENVASHLQKYRVYLKREREKKEKARNDPSLTAATDAGFLHDGFDLQAPAVSGQHPQQGLPTMHAWPRRVAADQIGFYNPDAQTVNPSRIRSNNTQMGSSQPGAVQSYGDMGMQVPTAPSPKTCSSYPGGNPYAILQTSFTLSQQQNHGHLSRQSLDRILSTMIPNENLGHVSGNQNTSLAGNYADASSYGAVVPQAQFQNSCRIQSAGAGSYLPLVSSSTGATLMFQEAVPATGNIEALSNTITSFRGANDSIPSYDHSSELRQDRRLHYNNPSDESAQFLGSQQNNVDLGSAIPAHRDRNATFNASGVWNSCPMISQRAEVEQNTGSDPQHNVAVRVQNPVGEKPESVPDPSSQDVLFAEDDNDLMSIVETQDQDVDEYCFDYLGDQDVDGSECWCSFIDPSTQICHHNVRKFINRNAENSLD